MKVIAVSVFAIGLGLTAVSAAQAMPIVPFDSSPAAAADTILVAGGCGPGLHRGPYGGCRPMFSCPRGWHPGPYGRRCFPNRRW